MNDTVKWILAVIITAVAFYLGIDLLGFDWITFQASILAFVQIIGMLLLLFTGSAAAIEVARYYHRMNEEFDRDRVDEQAGRRRSTGTEDPARQLPEGEERVTRSDLEAMLKRAVSEVVREESAPNGQMEDPVRSDTTRRRS